MMAPQMLGSLAGVALLQLRTLPLGLGSGASVSCPPSTRTFLFGRKGRAWYFSSVVCDSFLRPHPSERAGQW